MVYLVIATSDIFQDLTRKLDPKKLLEKHQTIINNPAEFHAAAKEKLGRVVVKTATTRNIKKFLSIFEILKK